jgi:hypothetical protein
MAGNIYHFISRFVSSLGGNNTRIFGLVMAAAILIVTVRVLGPFEVGKDQASQLEAAQRLVDGRGLTTTNEVPRFSYDIVDAPSAKSLIWWPPGFSLIVAGFLYTGLPLLASLKIIFASTTFTGWLGWAILISRFFSKGMKIGAKVYPIHLMALFIPIFFTPKWSGTDLFLWAGIPLIVLLFFKAGATRSSKSSLVLVAIAGFFFGALYAIRYASLFLGVAAALLLFQISLPNLKALFKRYAVFGLSAVTIMLPVFLYIKTHSHHESLPAYVNLDQALVNIDKTAHVFFFFLPGVASLIFGIPLIEQIIYKINWVWLIYLTGIICLTVIVAQPLVLLRDSWRTGQRPGKDMALGLSLLPISLVASITSANVNFLGVPRYYEPVALCGLLLACEMVSRRFVHRWIKAGAHVVLLVFLLHMFVYLPALALSSQRGDYVFSSVLGYMPPKSPRYQSTSHDVGFPDYNQIFSKKETSRLKLNELHEANPQALFFVEEYSYFVYDNFNGGGPVPGKNLRVFPTIDFWKHAYTSDPVKLFWVVNLDTKLEFISADNLRVVYSDEVEKTKILESDFYAGYRFFSSAPDGSPARASVGSADSNPTASMRVGIK